MWGSIARGAVGLALKYFNEKEICIKPGCILHRYGKSEYCKKHEEENLNRGCLVMIAIILIIGAMIYYD